MTARILLFTGKGGVGKTTTAAATALELARRGEKVVVTSADPAHSLGDAFGMDLGSDLREVAPGCEAQQLDALEQMESSWGEIRHWLVEVFDWAGLSAVEAEELAVLPGFEELVALTEIERLATSGRHDVVVVDCAPTAESIRLLSLPDLLDWYMQRLFPASRRMARIVGPVLSRVSDVPVARAEVFDAVERFHRRLGRLRDILTDPERTSVRLVLTPEAMVVAEARRTHTYLCLFGHHVDAVVVNRLLPEGGDAFMARWRAAQDDQMAVITEAFAPLPLICAPLAPGEILGIEALAEHGRGIWRGTDPACDMGGGGTLRLEHRGGAVVLVMELPHIEGREVDLAQAGGELSVAVGPYRRCVSLPDSLRGRTVTGATVRGGNLEVSFAAS